MNDTESNFDYDQRQLNLMDEQLSQFESGKIDLQHVISGLKSLQNSLRTIDQHWKEKFTADWWTLEQVYAVSLDRKKTTLSPKDSTLVKQAISNLKNLLASLKKNRNDEQPT